MWQNKRANCSRYYCKVVEFPPPHRFTPPYAHLIEQIQRQGYEREREDVLPGRDDGRHGHDYEKCVLAVAGEHLGVDDAHLAQHEGDHGQYDESAQLLWATGAALMIRREDWGASGGLDARFFAHQEEIDLCWRLRAMGRSIVCVSESKVWHVGGGSLEAGNPRKTFLNFRNNLLMLYKNLPEGELLPVMRLRTLLDYVAAFKFLLTGDVANFRAVLKARHI